MTGQSFHMYANSKANKYQNIPLTAILSSAPCNATGQNYYVQVKII